MNHTFEKYKPRKIQFEQLIKKEDWHIKIYSITNKDTFDDTVVMKSVTDTLTEWIGIMSSSNLPTYQTAFVIIHQAREGFLILLNWWTGGEMLETQVYFSSYDSPHDIVVYPYHPKALVCIWELEIFAHERQAWIDHVLLENENPNFKNYINDHLKHKIV